MVEKVIALFSSNRERFESKTSSHSVQHLSHLARNHLARVISARLTGFVDGGSLLETPILLLPTCICFLPFQFSLTPAVTLAYENMA